MRLNPGDIHWRGALRCHYPCGESHHHPAAERERGARHKQPGKAARETAMTALGLPVNCDDHAKKHHPHLKKKMQEMRSVCMCICAFGALTGKTAESPEIEKT